jgi:AGZA family xanthine/uracil permease-like MFS transporter
MDTFAEARLQIPPKWFAPGDVEASVGLFFSGFPDLLLIAALSALCGFTPELAAARILPAVALSIFAGNLFYAWQAHNLAVRTGRNDVTAIPFGVNAPTIFAYIFLIMVPVYQRTHDAHLVWQVGVTASFISGVVQTAGAFCTDWLRRYTPRAALLCPLAGIAMAFLCLGFIFGVFQIPGVALLPAVIILTVYASRLRLPFRMPAGLLAMLVGAGAAILLKSLHLYTPAAPLPVYLGVHLPQPVNLLDFIRQKEGWKYLSIIFPMSMLDTLVSLQVLESVKLAGDDYPTRPSLLMNGLATIAASLFGSPFPTALYFGHMAHKANGARAGYSIVSGSAVMLLCLSGLLPAVLRVVPLEVVAMVVVWFGLVMVGQAFQEVSKDHCIAVAFGLIPMLASWALQLVDLAAREAGSNLFAIAPRFGDELAIYGMISLSQGALLVSMVWAAALAWIFDRRFLQAAIWLGAGSIFSFFGLIHAYTLTPQGVNNKLGLFASPVFVASYAAAAAFLLFCHLYATKAKAPFGSAGVPPA